MTTSRHRVAPEGGPVIPPPEVGDRMLIWCDGGPSQCRLAPFPPPLEVIERDGLYVLVDDGPPHEWRYRFVPNDPS